jgi:uncharacterized protein
MDSPGPEREASDSARAALSTAAKDVPDCWTAGVSATEVAEALGLRPHREGGFFRETYRSPLTLPTEHGERCLATAIIYLLTGGSPSRLHRLRFDEVWFYHGGARAQLVMLPAPPIGPAVSRGMSERWEPQGPAARAAQHGPQREGTTEEDMLRIQLLGPECPQILVPGGLWLGARVAPSDPGGKDTQPVGDGVIGQAGEGEETLVLPDWTLAGCVVTPGFEYQDFELADHEHLLRDFPDAADLIRALS